MKGALRIAAGLLGMISAPAACFLLSPATLPAALVFPLLGVLRWRLGWLPVLGAFCIAPLLIAAWSAAAGREGATLVSMRWALSAGCGLYFAKRTGAASMGRLLMDSSRAFGRGGAFLLDLGGVLVSSGSLRRRMKGVRILGTPPSVLLEILREASEESLEKTHDTVAPDRSVFCEAGLSWALLLAGIAGF
jgi:hypothetical protein